MVVKYCRLKALFIRLYGSLLRPHRYTRYSSADVLGSFIKRTFFMAFLREITGFQLSLFFFAFRGVFFSPGKLPKKYFPYVLVAEMFRFVAQHQAGARCEPCRHSALYRIDQGHPQGHSQAVAGRRKRHARRGLYSSNRQSRLTDIAKIKTKSPASFMSWRAFSRQRLIEATPARYGEVRSPL